MQEKDKKLLAIGIMAGVCIAALLMVLGNLLSTPAEDSGNVTVPNFTGLQQEAVKDNEDYADFDLRFSEIHNGSDVGDHVIYAQSVAAGQKVTPGTTVTLSVNLEYTVLRLPTFEGGKLSAAQASLNVYGVLYNVTYQWTDEAKLNGTVAAQSPAPNTVISVLETPVDLTVWTTDGTVADPAEAPAASEPPAVKPQPQSTQTPEPEPTPTEAPAPTEAPEKQDGSNRKNPNKKGFLSRLVQGFFSLFEEEESAESGADDQTPAPEEQTPAQGEQTPQNTPVTEPDGTELPNVTGKSYEEACAILEQNGFKWVYYEHADGGGQPAETVISQDPAAGSQIDPTTHINLVLAR